MPKFGAELCNLEQFLIVLCWQAVLNPMRSHTLTSDEFLAPNEVTSTKKNDCNVMDPVFRLEHCGKCSFRFLFWCMSFPVQLTDAET